MKSLRAIWKLLRGLWHVVMGMWWIYAHFPQLSAEQREMRVQAWALQFLALWDIHLKVLGQPVLNGPALMVANHISWLDISVIHAARHCRFVAKSDIRHWPLIGTLATGSGSLYIERTSRKDALRMVKDMADAMKEGDVVAVFPEGTTSSGHLVGVFHANLFEAVIQHRLVVQPIALHYSDPCSGAWCAKASFVDDMDLMSSLHQILKIGGIRANVGLGEPLAACGHSRRSLAHLSHQTVCAHLRALQQPQELSHSVS